jgi:hypothetical protein
MNENPNKEAIRAIEEQVFEVTAGKSYKSMLLTPDAILLCSKKFNNAADFMATFDKVSGKTLTLTETLSIPYSAILRFRNQSGSDVIRIKTNGVHLTWPGEFDMANGQTDVHNIFMYLEKVKGYQRTENQLSSFKAILPNLGYVAICLGVTWLLFSMASGEIQESTSGRRRAKGELLKAFAEMLGPSGSLLAGLAATAVAGWFLWKKYNNPPVETVLE